MNDAQLIKLEETLQNQLIQLLEYKENIQFMKARINWISLEDKVATFFHTTALNKRRSKILQIQKTDQSWITDQIEI